MGHEEPRCKHGRHCHPQLGGHLFQQDRLEHEPLPHLGPAVGYTTGLCRSLKARQEGRFRLDGRLIGEDSRKELLRHAQCHYEDRLLDQRHLEQEHLVKDSWLFGQHWLGRENLLEVPQLLAEVIEVDQDIIQALASGQEEDLWTSRYDIVGLLEAGGTFGDDGQSSTLEVTYPQ